MSAHDCEWLFFHSEFMDDVQQMRRHLPGIRQFICVDRNIGEFPSLDRWTESYACVAPAKNHKNGAGNPLAHMQKDLGYDFCRNLSEKNPLVAAPLKRTDCSMISDGAAALVLADAETALKMKKAVAFRATSHVSDYLPMSLRDMSFLEGAETAWHKAYNEAGISIRDLDLVETHDCYTIAELIEYEAIGLTTRGEGARAVLEGWTEKDGILPINPSGGLKAKGHPIGATGVSMHVMAAMQTTGRAPAGIQIKNASLAGIFNMGGAAGGITKRCVNEERAV